MTAGRTGSPAQFSLKVQPSIAGDFELWRNSVSPMFEIAPVSPEAQAAFAMETLGYFLPGMAITSTTSSGCTFMRSRALIAKSGIENILVQVYVEGGYRLTAEGVQTRVEPGDIVVFDLMRECVIEAEPYTNIALTLQRDMLAPLIVETERLHGLVLRKGAPRNLLLQSHMKLLHMEAANFGPAEQVAVAQGTAALVASCLGPSIEHTDPAASPKPKTTLQMIRRAIDHRLRDAQLDPDTLALQFGLSRASIYRMFEPFGGVQAYIKQRRLMHAYQMVTDPSHFAEPINAIADQLGFSDSTAFSRAFRNLYRMTPSDVRAAARSGHFSAHDASQAGTESFGMLNRWLLGLDANAG